LNGKTGVEQVSGLKKVLALTETTGKVVVEGFGREMAGENAEVGGKRDDGDNEVEEEDVAGVRNVLKSDTPNIVVEDADEDVKLSHDDFNNVSKSQTTGRIEETLEEKD
jgi:hypothetical protein